MNSHCNVLILTNHGLDLKDYVNFTYDSKFQVYNTQIILNQNNVYIHLWLYSPGTKRYFMLNHIDYIIYYVQSIDEFVHLLKFRESLNGLNVEQLIITPDISFQDNPAIPIKSVQPSEMQKFLINITIKIIFKRIKRLEIQLGN